MKKALFLWGVLMSFSLGGFAQDIAIYPMNWWVGMKTKSIQLLIRSTNEDFSSDKVLINYPGITVSKTHQFTNKRYLAVDITIGPKTLPGDVLIKLAQNSKNREIKWPVKKRPSGLGTSYAQGVTSADFIDLIMVDRFSNGDESNDKVAGMRDQSLNRMEMYDRHGGDLQGVINHLDYLQGMGVTTLWFTPVLENDMDNRTEHGYSITNHYKVDARYGGDEIYKKLSNDLHQRGMKLIADIVYNHYGSCHFLALDPPDADWVHQWPTYTQTTYREQPLFDPYASKADSKKMSNGWFDRMMPDINHENEFMANFIIQNSIWQIEEFGIDGVRLDTYTYNNLEFANKCNQALLDEYPKLSIFGEAMVHGVANQAYFEQNNINTPFKSNLPSVVDFQSLYYGIIPALTQSFGWTEGVNRLYYTLSSDFLSKDPMRKVLLLDNHDEPRFYSVVGEDPAKQKIGYEWLLTCRGIPQMYYGSEVLMKGFKNPDGLLRSDFPGGFKGDEKNAFTGKGLTEAEKANQELVRKLANYRKRSSAITKGKMMHYVPVDGMYVYFRYDDNQTVMCVMNTANAPKEVDFSKYDERTSSFKTAQNIVSDERVELSSITTIPAMSMWVLELQK
ncbi:alpha-amylase [Solitalea longa]|uniref:Alpha-amylase n=1 Tax=Solitalea longa TaxID=2079460 RepID=A0A2S5A3L9_9SPHI|nr:alpha-amylase family glycosyl hydrolase [Solitalea longa]POY37180.1 alpha-amylase [Solitalea longa]